MKQKVSKYIADFFAARGVEHVFTITGGGAMHLNDAFGHHPSLKCVYNHHEQACAIAAEGYARLTGRIAPVCVTSGPGGTNAITGVLGAWLDSVPMFVVSGQVKRETTIHAAGVPDGLRQLGDQEFDIVSCVKTMTKYVMQIWNADEIRYHLEKAWYLSLSGRGGPVWIDVPLDIQAAIIETDELRKFNAADEGLVNENPVYDKSLTPQIIEHIKRAKHPVLFVGSGVRLANAHNELLQLAEKLQIPVVTAFNGYDLIWDEHPLYCGRPGTVGLRGGNFVVQNSDLLIVLGCRLNIRQISYNYTSFAKNAFKIIVDIDAAELQKPTIKPDLPIHANLKDVVNDLLQQGNLPTVPLQWLEWCKNIHNKYPAALPQYYEKPAPLNPYVFIKEFTAGLREDDVMVCGNGAACVITFQAAVLKERQRLFTNSGCASMGYGFPASLGCCLACNAATIPPSTKIVQPALSATSVPLSASKISACPAISTVTASDSTTAPPVANRRVICFDGDGSFQMNIQELQTVVHHNLNIKIIYINNGGYLSIKQTQKNLFEPPLVGVSMENGVSFPSAEKIANAYGIPFIRITSLDEISELHKFIEGDNPCFCEIVVDPNQNFEPKLSSKVLPDGKIISPEIDDMYPFLSREEYESNKFS
ncbi:MAG: thiamine pyrophosphate-binding protein [Bacteroidales bacterium]|jgi:acetolactate synthase-1/2/3 large subunit|nr:thiamine pyrophosphate-binding protein [Bacteroidales bacterium]